MYKSYFVQADGRIISASNDTEDGCIKLRIKTTFSNGAESYDIEITNTGTKEVMLGRTGIDFAGIEASDKRLWRIFSDLGSCGWAGVKRIDYIKDDPRMGIVSENGTFHRSDLQSVIWDADSGEAMLFGFLGQRKGANKIDIIPTADRKNVSSITAWRDIDCVLKPGEKVELDRIVHYNGYDPYNLLEKFAADVSIQHGRKFDAPPIVGMMTWYGYATAVTEEVVLENAEIISKLFNGYPQEMQTIMLIDHGWQEDANWGYFKQDKARFPHGLKRLSQKVGKYGVKLGLWHTPFCISPNAADYSRLRKYMARDEKGDIRQSFACVWGDLPGHSAGNWPINFFDGGIAAIQTRWKREMEKLRQWGAVYCKMDFFALQVSHFRKRNINTGDLYARTWSNFREGAGEGMHIAPCSCATNLQLGYCDSIRIGSDIGNSGHWPGAFKDFRYGLSTIAALWYKNRKFWVNDADSIQIAKGCSLAEARVRTTAVALSGGHVMLSEDLRMVDNARLEMIRRILPAYPAAAKPMNMFENPFPEGYPSIWSLSLDTGFGKMTVLAIFNLTQQTVAYKITPEMLGILPQEEYAALEWWQSKWLGRFKGEFTVEVPAEDVAVIHAQPFKSVPSVISVSHHITGGYIIENVSFDSETGLLKGELVTKAGIPMIIFGLVPEGWKLDRSERSHAVINSLRGWQKEVVTDGERTQFCVRFNRV